MKKKISIIFISVIAIIFTLTSISIASDNIKTYIYKTEELNISSEVLINGGTIQYSKPSPIYDFFDEEGKLNVIYTSEENVYWAKFDDNMKITNTIKFKQYYDKSNTPEYLRDLVYNFGNAVYYKKHLYVVYGRQGTTARNGFTEDTMAVVKYDKSGNIVAEKKLTAAHNNPTTDYTYGAWLPFFPNANCSLTINEQEETLACFFQTHMYNGHDRAGLFFIDINTMDWVSNEYFTEDEANISKYENIRYYWSSHSMAQRIISTSDGGYLMVDQNDASDRGLLITKVLSDENGNLQAKRYKMVHFKEGSNSTYGYNSTHLVTGNIIELSDGYMYIGAMERTLDLGFSNDIEESWDIFVQKYDKNFFANATTEEMQMFDTKVREATGKKEEPYNETVRQYLNGTEKDYGIKWLTDLNNEKTVIQIRAVEMENDQIAIIYEAYDLEEDSYGGYYYDQLSAQVYYMVIDGNGNMISKPTPVDNVNMTPEEILQYKDGKIYWTSTENGNSEIKLNVLDVANPITYTKGDVNNDGKINTVDAIMILQNISKKITLNEEQTLAADTSNDGKISTVDVIKILQYISKKITKF